MVRREKRNGRNAAPPGKVSKLKIHRSQEETLRPFQNIGYKPSLSSVVKGSNWEFEFIRKLTRS